MNQLKIPELPYIFRESAEFVPNEFDKMVPSFSNGQSFEALHSTSDLHYSPDFRAPIQLPHLVNPTSESMRFAAPHLSKQMTFSPKPAPANISTALRDFDETPVGPKSKLQKINKKKKTKEDEDASEK